MASFTTGEKRTTVRSYQECWIGCVADTSCSAMSFKDGACRTGSNVAKTSDSNGSVIRRKSCGECLEIGSRMDGASKWMFFFCVIQDKRRFCNRYGWLILVHFGFCKMGNKSLYWEIAWWKIEHFKFWSLNCIQFMFIQALEYKFKAIKANLSCLWHDKCIKMIFMTSSRKMMPWNCFSSQEDVWKHWGTIRQGEAHQLSKEWHTHFGSTNCHLIYLDSLQFQWCHRLGKNYH